MSIAGPIQFILQIHGCCYGSMASNYERITERIISLLEQGTVPWHRPWGGPEEFPKSLVSGRNYRGINAFLLSAAGYESPYWLTYKQAGERGGHVKKGEKGWPCVYWNWIEDIDTQTGEVKKRGFLKRYTVFNVAQTKNIPYPKPEKLERDFSPIDECESVISDMPRAPRIAHGHTRAAYIPREDLVTMPSRERFDNEESYYATLFHELVHSTGHESRLARKGLTETIAFGSLQYTNEELIAEMGSAFLCGHTGIEQVVIDNSASYIDAWLKRIKKDQQLVIKAAGGAQKAADYILDQDKHS